MYLFGVVELRYKYFYLITFGVSTIIDFSINTGGKISHIGGALFGVLYGYNLKKGIDLFNFTFLTKKKSKLKIVSYNKPQEYSYEVEETNDESTMNELLDKISKSGYDSLTKSEKERLFKLSQK